MSVAGEPSFDATDRQTVAAYVAGSTDTFIVRVATVSLVAAILTQKLAIPVSGMSQIEFPILVAYAMIGLLLSKRLVQFHSTRLALLAAAIVIAGVAHLVQSHEKFSLPAILLFVALYVIFLFVTPINRPTYQRILNNFTTLGLVTSGLVFMGWAMQFANLPLINMENFIPRAFLFNTYVYIQPVHWGSPYTKPNGIFFLETSSISQFQAMALIVEACFFRRIRRIAVLGLGVMSTFGGTGLLLLVLSAPLVLLHLRPALVVAAIVAAPLALVTANQIGLVDNIANRSDEFSKSGSSANQRFVVPIETVTEAFTSGTMDALFGVGAGNMPKRLNIVFIPAAKAAKEYGMVFFGIWFAYTFVMAFGNGVPFIVSWALFIQYHFLNGSFIVPINVFYIFILAGAYVVTREPDGVARRRTVGETLRGGPLLWPLRHGQASRVGGEVRERGVAFQC